MNNLPPKLKKATSAASGDSGTSSKSANEHISLQNNQDVVTIDVTAVEVPELTADEQRDRLHLERKVERAFFEAGKALMELRARRLYRSTHRRQAALRLRINRVYFSGLEESVQKFLESLGS